MAFLDDNFLLTTPTAQRLYHGIAAQLPIIDYHCHLSADELAADRHFATLYDIWLAGDHYKWRAMRADGVDEAYITGSAAPYEKFMAWCRTVPHTLRNPLYHWSHLELRRYFGIDCLISERTAAEIWERANARLAADASLSARGILQNFRVETLCTTDDPVDSLAAHRTLAQARANGEMETRVLPTFRPDRATDVSDPVRFNTWVDALAAASGQETASGQGAAGDFSAFKSQLESRHDFFHQCGCRLSDHGLLHAPRLFADEAQAAHLFARVRGGERLGAAEAESFCGHMMLFFARLDFERGWVKQLHLGPLRNLNPRLCAALGADAGCDSIGDAPQADGLAALLGRLEAAGSLPRTILYNLNPADNYVFAAMAGNFQSGSSAGKIQYGSGWWFLDQLDGMRAQIDALSNLGLLYNFVGMLTDSRSFLSYPRHEYFRRLLCQMVGSDVERGLLPDERELYEPLVRGVCYDNAAGYFGFNAV